MATQLMFKPMDLFEEGNIEEKLIVNDYDPTHDEVKSYIDLMVMKSEEGRSISLDPTCVCGELQGASYTGAICSSCGTAVTSPMDQELTYHIWLRRPESVRQFISPFLMELLLRKYTISSPSVRLVEYIICTDYRVKGVNRANISRLNQLDFLLEKAGIERGYNSFIDNFFRILDILEENFSKGPKREQGKFTGWIHENKDRIFSDWLPIPNRNLFVLDKNELGAFYDRNMIQALSAVRRFTGIDLLHESQKRKENKVAKSVIDLASFYFAYMDDSFFKKSGLFRQQIAKTRSHYTVRAVVVSRSKAHAYNEIEIPWTAACTLLRPIIMNGLTQSGMSYKKAVQHFHQHLKTFSPLINQIFQRVLLETGGLPVLLLRNPSLGAGSNQFLYATTIKTDPRDNTMGVSYLIAPLFNMDYDGDALCLTLLPTEISRRLAMNFETHHSLLDLTEPNKISGGALSLTRSLHHTTYNYLHKHRVKV